MYPILEDFNVITADAMDEETAILSCVIEAYAEDADNPHAAVYFLKDDTVRLVAALEFSVVSAAYGKGGEVGPAVLGDWGHFVIFQGDAQNEEKAPFERGPARCLKWIDDGFWSCGGALQVVRRTGPGQWEDVGPGDAAREEFGLLNCESLDGFSAQEVYVASDFGLIWYWDGQNWTPVQCQTNACFYGVHCGSNGIVYVVGQSGAVARGRRDSFELVHVDPAVPDFWNVAFFDNTVIIAAFTALFCVDEEDELALLAEPLDLSDSYTDLAVTDGVLWSVGMKDVMKFDGKDWTRIAQVNVD